MITGVAYGCYSMTSIVVVCNSYMESRPTNWNVGPGFLSMVSSLLAISAAW